MEEAWKRWMAAIMLSLVLPRSVVYLGSRVRAPEAEPTAPSATETTQQQPTQPLPAEPVYIRVLTDAGNIELMELEEYVCGVVLAEMPASFDPEALKAQAVAARTYALRRLTLQDRHSAGAICTQSICCQAWMSEEDYLRERGTRKEWSRIRAAVSQTAGQVLTYGGRLAESTYFSCSGGRTEDALAVWGEEIPYLQAVDSPGEEQAPVYREERFFTAEAFAQALGRSLAGSPEQWLGVLTYTPGGGVATAVIGGISYGGIELRKLLDLNSTCFTLTAHEDGITVTTLGNGHRVGLSQYGADAMAAAGSSYDQILSHYYPGTKIDKISDLE